ncbi:Zinc finger protein 423 [Anabarilius grahami]|uniref:Zinc finger protein 423 n=1 Tax=Anabarilius grahami TaxID=495550 RepID=A0A3N0YB46_ANAGA|nr:Zinc finger protein 423 [Anabarilius grahami]
MVHVCIYIDAAVSERDSDRKESRVTGEDGEQSVTSHDERVGEEDLDDDSIFTCDNCQHDFECLADLTEHRTNHCPADRPESINHGRQRTCSHTRPY